MALLKCQHYWLNWLDKDADFFKVYSFEFNKAFDFMVINTSLRSINSASEHGNMATPRSAYSSVM